MLYQLSYTPRAGGEVASVRCARKGSAAPTRCRVVTDVMSRRIRQWLDTVFTRIATFIALAAGQPTTFILALFVILVWATTGPMFNFSDTWQLIVNTGTTIITFLMVFLIQNSQNRDAASMQAKLDELLRALDKARSQFIGIEHLTDRQIELIREALEREAEQSRAEDDPKKGKSKTTRDTVDRLLDRF